MTPNPTHEQIDAWCVRVLGSPIDQVLFEAGFASRVLGLRLQDGTAAVAKVRRFTPRLAGATLVQRHLWEAGFPCPRPLVGPMPLGGAWISAEALVVGGLPLTNDLDAEFPAVAARKIGLSAVPLLCATEIPVPGSLSRVIRVLVHYYAPDDHRQRHVYLHEARVLRADLESAQ